MGRQLTLLILLIMLAGAAGSKWVLRASAVDIDASGLYKQPDTILKPAFSLDKSPVSDYLQASLNSQAQRLSAERYPTVDLNSSATISPSVLADNNATQSIESVYKRLANQGIFLTGIDDRSSYLDALFAAYFDVTESDTEHAIGIILGSWAKTHPAEAWQWIQSNDATGVLGQFRLTIVQYWLPIDADAALLAIMDLDTSDEKDRMLADYAAFIAIDEPERAFYWAYELTTDKARRLALDRVVYEWASSEPEQVILHLDGIAELEIRQQILFQAGPTITAQLIQTNPHRAMLWTNSLNKHEYEYLSPIAFQQWVNKNPTEAMNWLSAEYNSTNSELYMASAATTLPYQNLSVAMQVFPVMTATVQQNMASPIAFSLYQVNPNDAKLWTNNLQSATLQNNANRGILLATANTEPETALLMALDYTGRDQDQVLIDTAMEVDQQHPTFLENWLLTAPLNTAQVHKIRKALVRSPTD